MSRAHPHVTSFYPVRNLPTVRPLSAELGDHKLIAHGPLTYFGSKREMNETGSLDEKTWKARLCPRTIKSELYLGLFGSKPKGKAPQPLLAIAKVYPPSNTCEFILPNLRENENPIEIAELKGFLPLLISVVEHEYIKACMSTQSSHRAAATYLVPQENPSMMREAYSPITRMALNAIVVHARANLAVLPDENPLDRNQYVLERAAMGT